MTTAANKPWHPDTWQRNYTVENLSFEPDDSEHPFRVQVWGPPDANGFTDLVAEIDTFSSTLYVNNPDGTRARGGQFSMPEFPSKQAAEAWAKERIMMVWRMTKGATMDAEIKAVGECRRCHERKELAPESHGALCPECLGELTKAGALDVGLPSQGRVPVNVQTMRPQTCPVCESQAVWNSDGRCDVCGYLPPPRPFRAPDTDVAGRADESGGWFDPDLVRAPPFKLPKGGS